MPQNPEWRNEGKRLKDIATMKFSKILGVVIILVGIILLAFAHQWWQR